MVDVIFSVVLKEVFSGPRNDRPLLIFLDDTLLKKNGKKVSGTSWKRDPLGPKFSNNLVWAQRYLQMSVGYLEGNSGCRTLPILFKHCPVPSKPKKNAAPEVWQEYKKQQEIFRLPARAAEFIAQFQQEFLEAQKIIFIGDGGYTNQSVCQAIQNKNCYIGRLRKDSKLFSPPVRQNTGRGRKSLYGDCLSTPEQLRQESGENEWHNVTAATGNGQHTFKVKSFTPVRSKITKGNNVKLLIVQRLRYRLSRNSRLCYRDPAYLICTDVTLSDQEILQYYLWRWGIELNFKDEKTTFGIQEPQVRLTQTVENVPAFMVAVYSLLLLAAKQAFGDDNKFVYPKWRTQKTIWRPSSANYLAMFRMEILNRGTNKSDFVPQDTPDAKSFLFTHDWAKVVYHAVN